VNKRTGLVVDGHLRVELALARKEGLVPVVYVDLDEAEERLVLASLDPLAAMATTDASMLAGLIADVKVDDAALAAMLAGLGLTQAKDGLTDPDAVPEEVEPISKRGDLWLLGDHRLMCGDSTNASDVECVISGEQPPCLVFDPPWDAALVPPSGVWSTTLAFSDGRRAGELVKLLGAPVWVFVWDCVASWYTPNRPLQRVKLCFWYGSIDGYEFDGSHYGDAGEPHITSNTRGRYLYSPDSRGKHLSDLFALSLPRFHHNEATHRHGKPVDWVRCLIANTSSGDVYDPFLGSGTTMIACEQIGRRCFGMEIEPRYVDLAVKRWEQFTGKQATRG